MIVTQQFLDVKTIWMSQIRQSMSEHQWQRCIRLKRKFYIICFGDCSDGTLFPAALKCISSTDQYLTLEIVNLCYDIGVVALFYLENIYHEVGVVHLKS